MADPFSTGTGIVGVVGLAIQTAQVAVKFALDWKDAPRDVKTLTAEVQTLETTLSGIYTNIILNPEFAQAFQNGSSILLSQLGPDASPSADMGVLLGIFRADMTALLQDLSKQAKGHRLGLERIKGAFLSQRTQDSIGKLHRQCQVLNTMLTIDTATLGVTLHSEMKEARREQQGWHQDENTKELLSWLTGVDYGSQQSDILGRRQEGTGNWLLESDEFQNWCNGSRQTLFCPGMPGAGKTVIVSMVIDHLSSQYRDDSTIGIAYLYCNYRRRDEQKPAHLLANLLKQLLTNLSSMPESTRRLYERHKPRNTRPSFDEITNELRAAVNLHSRSFILVDALDECEVNDGGRLKFLSELLNLQSIATTSIFATSRDIPDIASKFTGGSAILEIRASDEDVRRYIEGHMEQLPSFVQRKVDLQEDIKAEIVNAVQGMYIDPNSPLPCE